MSEEILQLNPEQELLILKEWNGREKNPPSIAELIKLVWPQLSTDQIDGRNKYGRFIKEFLIKKGIKPLDSSYKPKGLIELTNEHKEYIANNYANMTSLEMARFLFNNNLLPSVSQEARSIFSYVKTLPRVEHSPKDDMLLEEYTPPNTLERVAARINKYVIESKFDSKNLSNRQKKQCQALMNYLQDNHFIHQINTYQNEAERVLFESMFIKFTYDKEDLTKQDLSQYLILCIEVIMSTSIQKTINMLQDEQNRQVNENDGKMSMTLVEAVNVARTEYNASVKRQQSLYKALTEERSKRLSEKITDSQSLLNLIELWKEEESRKKIIKVADERKKKLEQEIDRIENLDDLKAKMMGLSRNEILEG